MPPNVLVIVADQLAASALGAYGNRVTQAPALDRLAAEGAVFEHAYCASPLCVPSRGAFMSGMLPSRNGAYDNGAELAASIPTFAHYLRVLGYRTVLAGKMHFVGPDQMHGFEERVTADVYPAGLDWVPDWRLPASERLPWYHDMSSVERAGPVRASLQLDFDEEVAFRARRAIVDSARAADGRPAPARRVLHAPTRPVRGAAPALGALHRRRDRAAARSRTCRSRSRTPTAGACSRCSTTSGSPSAASA